MNTTTCKIGGSPPEYSMQELTKFHGHLGPYIVLGYRMGRYARIFFSGSKEISAVVHCSDSPPESCLADGIQIGSGCTFGRRKIRIDTKSRPGCTFHCGNETLVIWAYKPQLPEISNKDYWELIHRIAEAMYVAPDEQLFAEDPDSSEIMSGFTFDSRKNPNPDENILLSSKKV